MIEAITATEETKSSKAATTLAGDLDAFEFGVGDNMRPMYICLTMHTSKDPYYLLVY